MSEEKMCVAVIGAGTMGIGIAEVAAAHSHPVVLYDVNQEFVHTAVQQLEQRLSKRVEKGKITHDQAQQIISRIEVVEALESMAAAQLVIEAVIEDLSIKQNLFQQLEEICSDETILASNTSSISITAIASVLKRPERVVGIHFFNPAPVMKLVEVIAGQLSTDAYLNKAMHICEQWNKVVVKASSTPGFIVNRVARPFYGEPLKMVQEQLAEYGHIDHILTEAAGFRMGPFGLMDLIGIDINFAVSKTVYQAMFNDPRYRPSLIQSEMVAAGLLGRKTGAGFYDYNQSEVKSSKHSELKVSGENLDPVEQTIVVRFNPESYAFRWLTEYQSNTADDLVLIADNEIEGAMIGDCHIVMTSGALSAEVEAQNSAPTALIDFSFNYKQAQSVHLCLGKNVSTHSRAHIIEFFSRLNKSVYLGEDQPAMIAMRTVSLLINEAADAVFNGVCSVDDVDKAMRFGVNYPSGLLAVGEQIGWKNIVSVLDYLQAWFGDDRYRSSVWIRNKKNA